MRWVCWEELPESMRTEEVRPYYEALSRKRGTLVLKRALDILLSSLALLLIWPVYLVLAVAIKLDSPGPVFYRAERITQYGRPFRIHKFRTMVCHADKGSAVTVNNDSRITRVGKAIRACRLDETAQLLDVLSGSLTLVGTRPESPHYVEHYTPEMMATLLLPAGVTSKASIYYKDEALLLDGAEDSDRVYVERILPAKMKYNLCALEELSLGSDIRIMLMTVLAVLGREYNGEEQ